MVCAGLRRKAARQAASDRGDASKAILKERKGMRAMPIFGETDWSCAGERPVRDSRLGRRTFLMGEYSDYSAGPSRVGKDLSSAALAKEEAQSAATPLTTPGAVNPQSRAKAQTSEGPKSPDGVKNLSTSR